MRLVLVMLLSMVMLGGGIAPEAFSDEKGADYHTTGDVMRQVDATLKAARDQGKLALFALGANWCHDSRGFAHKLTDPAIQKVVDASYVTMLVNVGYYDQGLDVAHRFGRPTIFSTPTILIIDPETEQQVNEDSMHLWSRAASLSLPAMADQLARVADAHARDQSDLTAVQRDGLARIDAFEQRISKRITRGFAVVGPVLKAHQQGKSVDMDAVWDPLAALRRQLMKDVTAMRAQVRDHRGDTPVVLTFPTYSHGSGS